MLKSDCIRANTEWSGIFVYHRKCNIYHKSWVYRRWSKYLAPHRSDGRVVFSETMNFETLSLKTRSLLILKSFDHVSSFENVHMYAKLSRSLSSRFGATRKLQDFKRLTWKMKEKDMCDYTLTWLLLVDLQIMSNMTISIQLFWKNCKTDSLT